MEILIISGLSGAGKSSAATYLEDMGYYTVDNVPADIILKFAEFCSQSVWKWKPSMPSSSSGWKFSIVMPSYI